MSQPVIKVENVSKQYRLGKIGTGTLTHDLNRWWHTVRGKQDPYLKIGAHNDQSKSTSGEYVWALKDISLEVKQGDVVGIIGRNGAGKSTLLKLLSRTTLPSAGSIKLRGRIASLLEVGTGFHPELTGRENIFLNGAILGMTKQEIRIKFDEIVDFSGVEKYIDTPVKRYSSGMYVRLAFAVAAHLDPEILIVDEVLAVGDAEFQKKALGKMQLVSEGEGRTVLFVSHNMASIKKLCSSAIILSEGKLEFQGDTTTAIQKYLNLNNHEQAELPSILDKDEINKKMDGLKDGAFPFLTLNRISILNDFDQPTTSFSSSEPIKVKFDFDINFGAPDFRIVVSVVDDENNAILNSQLSDSSIHENTIRKGSYSAICHFQKDLFATNTYLLTLHFINVKKEHYVYNGIAKFRVRYHNPKYIYAPFDQTYFRPNLKWELTENTR